MIELVATLENPNAWWRETAQRLLYLRQDRSAVTPLRELKARENQTVFLAHGRFGLSNHGPEYAGAIVQATS